jgi:xylulose-5-phosphate/fructose-6-phosphate phosphoketolase
MGTIDSLQSEVNIKKSSSDRNQLGSEYIVGSFRAHQVPLPLAASNEEQLSALEAWLKSYRPEELFEREDTPTSRRGAPVQKVLSIIPQYSLDCMGMKIGKHAALADAVDRGSHINSLGKWHKLDVPKWQELAVEKGSQHSCMKVVGTLLRDVIVAYVLLLV